MSSARGDRAPFPIERLAAALRRHWPEYLIEAAGLGAFMVSACVFTALFEHPLSPVRQGVSDAALRRAAVGAAMGLTAVALIYSGWGMRSGAHLNPAVTLAFLRLGKVDPPDAVFYVLAQFAGGIAGVAAAGWILGGALAHPSVVYAVTVPGAAGIRVAFAAEMAISFGLMMVVLVASNARRLAPYTGAFAGALIFAYIALEAPLSGMSMNPARTLGSAVPARLWTALWVYFTAPPLGMLAAAAVYRRVAPGRAVLCAKLHHPADGPCVFRCGMPRLAAPPDGRVRERRADPAATPAPPSAAASTASAPRPAGGAAGGSPAPASGAPRVPRRRPSGRPGLPRPSAAASNASCFAAIGNRRGDVRIRLFEASRPFAGGGRQGSTTTPPVGRRWRRAADTT